MRFLEFKLPAPGSAFDAELKQHLLTLVNDAKKLPEADPKRIQFNQFLQNIKAEAGITEDPVADADQAIPLDAMTPWTSGLFLATKAALLVEARDTDAIREAVHAL